jgi:hypothetical protein
LPVRTLAEIKKDGGLERVRGALLKWVRGGEMVERLRGAPWFGRRIRIIEDAFSAHCEGRYNLSVPVLLAQVEGSIRDLGVRVGVGSSYLDTKGRMRWKALGRVVGEITDRPFECLRWFSSVFFTRFLVERHFRARNAIMHGEEVEYGTEELSANCLLALEEVRLAREGVERVFSKEKDIEAKVVVDALRPALERLAEK